MRGLWWSVVWPTWPATTHVVAAWVVAAGLITCVMMARDKLQARRGARRIRERTLLLWAVVGGGLGGLLGMWFFRHKTRRILFWSVNGLAAVVWVAAVAWTL